MSSGPKTDAILRWKRGSNANGPVFELFGAIDEHSPLSQLFEDIEGAEPVQLDMAGVARVNSIGAREWIRFVGKLPRAFTVYRCSPSVVAQMNMIANFMAQGVIESVQAPYYCPSCRVDALRLLRIADLGDAPELDPLTCAECGGEMEFDDVEDAYFAFMADRGKPSLV